MTRRTQTPIDRRKSKRLKKVGNREGYNEKDKREKLGLMFTDSGGIGSEERRIGTIETEEERKTNVKVYIEGQEKSIRDKRDFRQETKNFKVNGKN